MYIIAFQKENKDIVEVNDDMKVCIITFGEYLLKSEEGDDYFFRDSEELYDKVKHLLILPEKNIKNDKKNQQHE